MNHSRIALKPYLDAISGYCDTLSNEELTDVIISLAKDVSTSGRVEFLEKIESYLPGHRPEVISDAYPVEQILDNIEALKESIEERIDSIEDGSYWDDPDYSEDNGYYDDDDDNDPDYVSDEQAEDLESFFDDAENLFSDDNLVEARIVYDALFRLIGYVRQGDAYFSLSNETDIREARARYCRCVYETSEASHRLEEFAEAMEIDMVAVYHENDYNEDYPLMQDVIDARPNEMDGLESFLPEWKKVLAEKGTKGRPAGLLLETINRLKGLSGVSRLARKWKNSQPQGYLFWLNILKAENDLQGIIKVSAEGLKALNKGKPRERVAEFMADAAAGLGDARQLLLGRRERFFSQMSDQNLLELIKEAKKQQVKDMEFEILIGCFTSNELIDEEKGFYTKVLLMSGNLGQAFDMVKKEKGVGWSYQSQAGVVFGAVLYVCAGCPEKAGTIKALLKGYANKISIYSERFTIQDDNNMSFYDEIINGLKQAGDAESQADIFFAWAKKIGQSRIDHIVSNKHRSAYERAAQVLGALAETYLAMGEKNKAVKLLHLYYNEKYSRFSAFRREVKSVVIGSDLLKTSGFKF